MIIINESIMNEKFKDSNKLKDVNPADLKVLNSVFTPKYWKETTEFITRDLLRGTGGSHDIVTSIDMMLQSSDNLISDEVYNAIDNAIDANDDNESIIGNYLDELIDRAPKLLGKELLPELKRLMGRGLKVKDFEYKELQKMLK